MEDNKQAAAEAERRRILDEADKPAVTRALESIEQGAPGKPVALTPVAPVVSGTVHTVETGDAADNEPTLNLSAINKRLAPLSISGAGLAQFDIEPLAVVKNSKLYSEAQFSNLLCELVDHISRVTAKARLEQLEAA